MRPENAPLVIPWSALTNNDSRGAANESAQALTVTQVSNAVHGQATLGSTDVTFTPQADYNGPASFDYTVCDDGTPRKCSTQTAKVSITVDPVNSAPVAEDKTLRLNEDGGKVSVNLAALVSDKETADANLSFDLPRLPTAGQGTLTRAGSVLAFEPATDYNGTVQLPYTVTDRGDPDACGAGGAGEGCDAPKSSKKTVTIIVNPVNDAPSFTIGKDQTVKEDAGYRRLSGWATGISKGPANEAGQTVSFAVANDNKSLFSRQPAISPNGTLTYTPAADKSGEATVSVRVLDDGGTRGGGVNTSGPQRFKITVVPVKDRPVANDDRYGVDTNKTLTVRPPGVLRKPGRRERTLRRREKDGGPGTCEESDIRQNLCGAGKGWNGRGQGSIRQLPDS